MSAKFQLFKGTNQQFYFRLKAGNGEIILSSEGYTTKQNCQNGITSVRANSPFDANYDRKDSANGKLYFTLLASNSQIIGVSQMYSSTSARETGINSVKTNAPTAPIEDLTL